MVIATAIPQAIEERLDRYRSTLNKLRTEGADPRIIRSWEARITKLSKELIPNTKEADMPRAAVKDKPQTKPQSAKEKALAKQAGKNQDSKNGSSKAQVPAKATTATPTKPKSTPAQTKPVPTKQVTKQAPKPTPVTIKGGVKKLATNGPVKGVPGKNNKTYPDLNKTDPTFGGRGTTHCMCGCRVPNRRGVKFAPGHDNRLRQILGRIERGEESGESIAQTTLDDLRANKTLTVGSYTAAQIIKLSTRRPRGRRK